MTSIDDLRLSDFLAHILDAIERCQRYIAGMDEAELRSDQKTQDAVIRTFEIVGEASNNIIKRFPDFAAEHPEIPWRKAVGMRNILAHGYFTVDLGAVWKTIHSDLPDLQRKLRDLADTDGDKP
jgi:uncharacterized protein with HEPN domain